MIGNAIFDFIEAQIVMDELVGRECKYNKHNSFDMTIINHSRRWLGAFIMIDVECLFFNDNSGGQIKIGNLNEQMKSFFKKLVEEISLRRYDSTYAYTLYIENEADERVILSFLSKLYGVEALAV